MEAFLYIRLAGSTALVQHLALHKFGGELGHATDVVVAKAILHEKIAALGITEIDKSPEPSARGVVDITQDACLKLQILRSMPDYIADADDTG